MRLSRLLTPVYLVAAVRIATAIWVYFSLGFPSSGPAPIWTFPVAQAVFGLSAVTLFLGSRRDPRASLLGGSFLLTAAAYSSRPLVEQPALLERLGTPAQIFLLSPIEAFLPFLMWSFVSEFPRVRSPDRWLRAVCGCTFGLGFGLLALSIVQQYEGPPGALDPPWSALDGRLRTGSFQLLVYGLTASAVPICWWRGRHASVTEQRRVRIFSAGLIGGTGVPCTYIALTAIPQFGAWSVTSTSVALVIPLMEILILTVPLTTAYAVVVEEALELRLIVGATLRYGLARTAVTLYATLPFVLLVLYLYEARDASLAQLATDPRALGITLAMIVGLSAVRLRRRLLTGIDRRFYREPIDSATALMNLADAVRDAPTLPGLIQRVSEGIESALHPAMVSLFLKDPYTGSFHELGGTSRGLDGLSPVAELLASRSEPLSIDPGGAMPLPEAELAWLDSEEIRMLVPMPGTEGQLMGFLALGAKRNELPYSRSDRKLLTAVAVQTALAMENRLLRESLPGVATSRMGLSARTAETSHTEPARICEVCSAALRSNQSRCCGGGLTEASIPYVLSGKFRLERRLGAGASGEVYLASDMDLRRRVALKALRRTSPQEAAQLRLEAVAAAALKHPNLAAIYGTEIWRGTPVLIFELLEKGTLAERISTEPMPPVEALRMAIQITNGLAHAHARRVLHRDIKPSNIGFSEESAPKLLDFGVARLLDRESSAGGPPAKALSFSRDVMRSTHSSQGLVGTPLYWSPEVLSGSKPGPSFDTWALSVTLYEAITRKNPVERDTWEETAACIRRGPIQDVREHCPKCPESVALAIGQALLIDPNRRPASADALRICLEAAARSL